MQRRYGVAERDLICDGTIFSRHPVFSHYDNALQIIAYFDELEICNPIGISH